MKKIKKIVIKNIENHMKIGNQSTANDNNSKEHDDSDEEDLVRLSGVLSI